MDFVAVNGVLFHAKLISGAAGVKDLAFVYGMSYGAVGTFDANTLTAKILLTDGTKKTVTVAKLYPDVNSACVVLNNGNLTDEGAYTNKLVTYKVNNDGEYEFTLLTNNNKTGFDSFAYTVNPGTDAKDNEINGTVVADDAAILPVTKYTLGAGGSADAVKLLTGKEYRSVNNNASAKFEAGTASVVVGKDSDGFTRVRAAVVMATAAANDNCAYNTSTDKWNLGVFSGSNYGYLVRDAWTKTRDGNEYNVFEVWNGSDTVTLYEKNSSTVRGTTARAVISYDIVDDTTIKNVSVSGLSAGAVTAYSAGSNTVSLVADNAQPGSTEYKNTNNTVILNINDADKAGVSGNAVNVAREIGDTGIFVPNAYYYVASAASGSEVLALVIDVNKSELNSYTTSGLVQTADSATDGLGVSGDKIGVPAATSAALAKMDAAAIKTYVEGLFTNEAAIEAITNNTATSQGWSTYAAMKGALTMMTPANGVASFKITTSADVELVDGNMNTDYSDTKVVITALNDEVVTITDVELDLTA